MKDILIIAHFTQIPGEKGNGRFHYIAEKLYKKSNEIMVEVVTSSFSHKTKSQRNMTKVQLQSVPYKVTMLHEPGYSKNVSLKRFYSHYIFANNLKKYLEKRTKPDVIYCAVPSLDVAYVAANYCKQNNIKFIIDIQDLWPEAFEMVFKVPILSDLLYYPMKRMADYIYSCADEIFAVSETYAERAMRVNKKCYKTYSVFLGTDLNYFDRLAKENKISNKPVGEIWLVYIGTLGHSYDIKVVIDALKILQKKEIRNIKFIVMGDGPLKPMFENYAKEQDIYSEFTGRLDYGKMLGILTECDIGVNPISRGAAQSIINKHGDYAAAGLPVLNTQESTEYRKLVDDYNFGFNCENSNSIDLAEKLIILYKDESLRKEMGKNNRKVAEEKFDRNTTYETIIKTINEEINIE